MANHRLRTTRLKQPQAFKKLAKQPVEIACPWLPSERLGAGGRR